METLFWCMLGIGIVIAISRYNEDDKLFWKLLISFIGTFAAAAAVISYVQNSKKDKVVYLDTNPMQVLDGCSHIYCVLAEPSTLAIHETPVSKPASKEFLVKYTNPVLSEVAGGARDQPSDYFDTS